MSLVNKVDDTKRSRLSSEIMLRRIIFNFFSVGVLARQVSVIGGGAVQHDRHVFVVEPGAAEDRGRQQVCGRAAGHFSSNSLETFRGHLKKHLFKPSYCV